MLSQKHLMNLEASKHAQMKKKSSSRRRLSP